MRSRLGIDRFGGDDQGAEVRPHRVGTVTDMSLDLQSLIEAPPEGLVGPGYHFGRGSRASDQPESDHQGVDPVNRENWVVSKPEP